MSHHAVIPLADIAIGAGLYAILALGYSWVALPWLSRRMDTGPIDGFAAVIVRAWLGLIHRPVWIGFDAVRPLVDGPAGGEGTSPRGAIIIANHASGIDAFLLQLPFRRRIRWMMAKDQMLPAFDGLWRHLAILPVTYGPGDATTFREAMRHVQAGGVLGLFPEGGIAKPPCELRPFLAGVGLIVARSKVPVVVCWIQGAPDAPSAFASLVVPSRVRVHCLGVFDGGGERDPATITASIRGMIQKASGWPLNDDALPGTTLAAEGAKRERSPERHARSVPSDA
jgi:1-acyl-sn-glycerol-3-phosphate acyltransferase